MSFAPNQNVGIVPIAGAGFARVFSNALLRLERRTAIFFMALRTVDGLGILCARA